MQITEIRIKNKLTKGNIFKDIGFTNIEAEDLAKKVDEAIKAEELAKLALSTRDLDHDNSI